jgi:integrase
VTEARWRLAAGEAWSGSGLVLTTRLGDPIDPRNFHRYFKARVAKSGVPVISVHATRRTCASLLVRPQCAPSRRDGDPPAQQDRGHDGHLQPGLLGIDAHGAQAAGEAFK